MNDFLLEADDDHDFSDRETSVIVLTTVIFMPGLPSPFYDRTIKGGTKTMDTGRRFAKVSLTNHTVLLKRFSTTESSKANANFNN